MQIHRPGFSLAITCGQLQSNCQPDCLQRCVSWQGIAKQILFYQHQSENMFPLLLHARLFASPFDVGTYNVYWDVIPSF